MTITNVRLTVRDWDGTYRHERYLAHADPAMRMQVPADGFEIGRTQEGDCLELTFQGLYPSLLIEERDVLELDLEDAGTWRRVYAGVTTKSGNSQLVYTHSNLKATGLRKRLGEVTITYDVPDGDLAAQFVTAVQSVIASGQLGAAVILDVADCPDTGILEAGHPTGNRKLSEFLDYLADRAGRVWGVDARRHVYFRVPSTSTITLAEGTDAVLPTYDDTDSEALVTSVPFIAGTDDAGTPIRQTVTLPEAGQYGTAACPDVILDAVVRPWLDTHPAPVLSGGSIRDGSMSLLTDGITTGQGLVLQATSDDTTLLQVQAPVGARLLEVSAGTSSGGPDVLVLVAAPQPIIGSNPPAYTYVYSPMFRLHNESRTIRLTIGDLYRVRLDLDWSVTTYTTSLQTFLEFRVDTLDAGLLMTLAQAYSVLPTRDPATVTVLGQALDPAGTLVLNRVTGGAYTNPIESVTLHVKTGAGIGENGSVATIIKAGQRLSAEEQARRFLDKRALAAAAAMVANARS